jgi:hypothetical protein
LADAERKNATNKQSRCDSRADACGPWLADAERLNVDTTGSHRYSHLPQSNPSDALAGKHQQSPHCDQQLPGYQSFCDEKPDFSGKFNGLWQCELAPSSRVWL